DRAIPKSQLCDGHWDCRTDEFNCAGGERFSCDDGRTIPLTNKCDGQEHCRDGSDERRAACPHQLLCRNSRPSRYVSVDKVCDGQPDCPDGWEEQTCSNFFSCGGGLFVRRDKRCDGAADCPGGQDESACAR
ncbi:MAG TPA: low-density lipoprotein receptor class A repeat-containing protein, partial [Polyangiaceae bacterium]|nr:low-density lipoprotein receptor class A repeat-containing protein [Polyangiaceae bacterium]